MKKFSWMTPEGPKRHKTNYFHCMKPPLCVGVDLTSISIIHKLSYFIALAQPPGLADRTTNPGRPNSCILAYIVK